MPQIIVGLGAPSSSRQMSGGSANSCSENELLLGKLEYPPREVPADANGSRRKWKGSRGENGEAEVRWSHNSESRSGQPDKALVGGKC